MGMADEQLSLIRLLSAAFFARCQLNRCIYESYDGRYMRIPDRFGTKVAVVAAGIWRYRFHTGAVVGGFAVRYFPGPYWFSLLFSRNSMLFTWDLHCLPRFPSSLQSESGYCFRRRSLQEKYEGGKMKKDIKKRNTILTIAFNRYEFAYMPILQLNSASHFTISVIERSAIYAVVAVAMNMLTGFQVCFLSGGGFMAIRHQ